MCAAGQGQTRADAADIKLQTHVWCLLLLTRVPPPTVPATPLSCLVVYTASLKAPLTPPPPPLTSCKGGLTKGEKVNVLLAISLAHDPGRSA